MNHCLYAFDRDTMSYFIMPSYKKIKKRGKAMENTKNKHSAIRNTCMTIGITKYVVGLILGGIGVIIKIVLIVHYWPVIARGLGLQ